MQYLERNYTKKELKAYVSNMHQIAGAERFISGEGNSEGAKLIRVNNGSGLDFTVIESRCMDILSLSYKGIPINFLSKNGLVYPIRYQPYDAEDTMKYLTGGMLYTCGTANVGWECIDNGKKQVNHGRMKSMSATNTSAVAFWENDEYIMKISGEMHETSLFDEDIVLRRSICTKLGGNQIEIVDEIENESFASQPFMYMYHINLGFPMVDDNVEIITKKASITVRDAEMSGAIAEYRKMNKPEYPGREVCLTHSFKHKGVVVNGAYNDRLGIGFYVRQNTNEMPFLHEWKTNIAGTYALGLEPANCHCEGLVREREIYHTLQKLEPFEKRTIRIEIGVVEGRRPFEKLFNA